MPSPEAEAAIGPIGDLGISIHLRSLNHNQPAEIGLVANCFIEVRRQLLDLAPFHTHPTNH